MSKIGVMMSAHAVDEKMSSHFGKAEWVMVADTESSTIGFEKNDALNGKSAVEIVIRAGCTDVILTDIGDGALRHLQAASIRSWVVPEPVSGSEAFRMFGEGLLTLLPAARLATNQGARASCCCSSGSGSAAASCCGS